jgi:two-component system NtrC family sensor kinase
MNKPASKEKAKSTAPSATRSNLGRGLAQMMDETDVLVVMTDLDGHVIAWNRAMAKLTGRPEAEGRGLMLGDWLTGAGVRDLADIMAKVARGRESIRCEVRLPGATGAMAAAAFSVIPVRGSRGEPVAVLAAGHDLTALRALQSQVLHAEKLATVGQVAAGVAHEINNPLTSIQMCAEAVLRKATLAAEGRVPNVIEPIDIERLRKIQEGAERIHGFSRDLTTYARPSGRDVEEVDLNEVVEHALSFCEPVLYETKAELLKELSPDLPPVRAVRDHIMQVVTNLVRNAAQALVEPGASVTVRTFRSGKAAVGLAVSDNGEGIRPEDEEHVFDPFFTTKPAGKGTGLGLTVVRNIVFAHGGQISFQSMAGRGTTFVVSLPIDLRPGLPLTAE